jgi:hypothetical protein
MGRERGERRKRGENMVGLVNGPVGGLKVPLRAFCCKARGGGGRLRQATETGKKEKRQEKEVYI